MKNWLISVLVFVVLMAGVEGIYRWNAAHEDPYRKGSEKYWRQMLEEMPATEREQFLRDRMQAGQQKYHDYGLYAVAPFESRTVTFGTYYSSRLTPDSVPLEKARQIVWAFGGSTMQNLETADKHTIANQIAANLKKAGWQPFVANFGVGSFQSTLEMIKFMKFIARVPKVERPQFAVFYDGFNDPGNGYRFGAGRLQSDLAQKLALMVEQKYGRLALYAVNEWLGKRSVLWEKTALNPVRVALFDQVPVAFNEDNLQKTVDIYLGNMRSIGAVCEAYGVKCLFVLQPLNVVKQGRSAMEEKAISGIEPAYRAFTADFYKAVQQSEEVRKHDFLDLSGMFDNDGRSDFYDIGHTGPYTGYPIGARIAEQLVGLAQGLAQGEQE